MINQDSNKGFEVGIMTNLTGQRGRKEDYKGEGDA